MQKLSTIALLLMVTLLTSCGKKPAEEAQNQSKEGNSNATLVSVTQVQKQTVEITQTALGSIEGLIDPTVASETAAKVIKVHVNAGDNVKKGQLIATLDSRDFNMQRREARAEVARIQAQLTNQQKVVERNRALVDKNFISQNALDNETAQLDVFKEQLAAAKARVNTINHNSSKSKLFAPVSGVVETKLVDTGDFVRVGDPIIQIVSKKKLRAILPFPEHIGTKLKPGLTLRLSTQASDQTIETVIKELKPKITEDSRTVNVIADIDGANDWLPGASVKGTVVLGESATSIMVPEESLVLRPAGEVVYVVRDNIAHQTIVKSGLHQNGLVEITDGLTTNQTIAVDGAGFLTDQAKVNVAKPE